MANSFTENVHFVDTDDTTLSGIKLVESIKYIGNTNGTVVIKSGTSSGAQLWQGSGASDFLDSELCIRAKEGLHIAITNGAKVYIYLK